MLQNRKKEKMTRIIVLLMSGLVFFFAFTSTAQSPAQIPCTELEDSPAFIESDTLPQQIPYEPQTLEESLDVLDRLFNPYQKRFITCLTEEGIRSNQVQYGLGVWIRQVFGLWGASPLRYHFLERGVLHPDDMAGIMLVSYYRKLTGRSLRVKQQVNYYQKYWKDQGVNIDSLLQAARKQ